MGPLFTGSSTLFVVLAIAVAIAWIFMPFAIFGTKPLLKQILKALEENNRLLEGRAQRESGAPPSVHRTDWK